MKKKFIIGKNCVNEVLSHQKERILLLRTAHSEDDALVKKFQENKIKIISENGKKLEKLVNSTSHQGYVAEVTPNDTVYIEDIIQQSENKKKSIVVILDCIFDPQNIGAILRSCECFGVDAVIISRNRGGGITPTATKISVGATELVPIAEVSNLQTTIEKFQKAGYWSVACEVSNKAQSLSTFDFPEKTLLILGSEQKGVQKIISKKSDFHVYIPMLGKIDSLNVSNAASVFLYKYTLGK